MRFRPTIVVLGMGLVLAVVTGCTNESAIEELQEQNKSIVRRVHEEFAKGNLAVFDEVLSPTYIRHCQAMPPGLQEMHGTEQFKVFLAEFLEAAPDTRDTIDLIIAEGDKVAYITTMTGTQTGQMGSLSASGKSFTLVNIIVHRFEDGKIAESWVSWDNVAMLTQLGFFPPPSDN